MSVSLIQSAVSLPQSPFPPLGGLFIGLACVYAVDFLASLKPDPRCRSDCSGRADLREAGG